MYMYDMFDLSKIITDDCLQKRGSLAEINTIHTEDILQAKQIPFPICE